MDTQSILNELRAKCDRINTAIAALEGSTGKRGPRSSNSFPTRRRRRMSAAARKRISQAMKARWAAKKKGARPQQKTASKQKRRGGITAAGRKRLSEMMKQRWAERRKQAKSA